MPAFFTHYLGGQRMLELTENKLIRDPVHNYQALFNLGTQGPDLFFYHRAWPWTKSQSIGEVGEMLHIQGVSEYFSCFLDYIIHETGEVKKMLSSYLYGFTCHYALDLYVHPYVYYKTGFTRPGEAPTKKFAVNHHKMETALDVLMLNHILGAKPYAMNASRLILLNSDEAETVGKMYEAVIHLVFGLKVSAYQVVTGIKDMRRIRAGLRDRSGLKKKILALAENILGQPQSISSMICPAKLTDGLDYLNEKNKPWSLPWDEKVRRTDSFMDIFVQASQEAVEMCETISSYLAGRADKEQALQRIGNRSFTTGIDCSPGVTLQYYDCIFPASDS